MIEQCHIECGPIVERLDGLHVHENEDGPCYHPDNDEDSDDPILMLNIGEGV